MSTPIAYGLDFGTSNSSVSVAFDDRTVDMVPIDPGGTMPHSLPSIAYLHRNGNRAAGQNAAEEFLITEAKFSPEPFEGRNDATQKYCPNYRQCYRSQCSCKA